MTLIHTYVVYVYKKRTHICIEEQVLYYIICVEKKKTKKLLTLLIKNTYFNNYDFIIQRLGDTIIPYFDKMFL